MKDDPKQAAEPTKTFPKIRSRNVLQVNYQIFIRLGCILLSEDKTKDKKTKKQITEES